MSEDLPSINDFIEDKSNLPSVDLFTEGALPIQESFEQKKKEIITEDEVTQVVREQPDNTALIVSLIENVRNSIPEVKSYDKELFEIVNLIEQLKNDIETSKTETLTESKNYDYGVRDQLKRIQESIPVVPEVKYYDQEIQELREDLNKIPHVKYYDEDIEELQEGFKRVKRYDEDIVDLKESLHDLKNRSNIDHRWIGTTFSSIDENFDTLSSSLSTFKGRLDMEIKEIVESLDTREFEDKVDKKNLNERVDETHQVILEQKEKIYSELKETSLRIWNLNKEYKNDDEKLQTQINEQYVYLKEAVAAIIEGEDQRYTEVYNQYNQFSEYVDDLKEQVVALHGQRDYSRDIKKVNISVKTVKNLVEELEKKLDDKVYQLQADLQEGLLNIPPTVDNSDPLTPLDQLETTIEGLSKSYRLFVNRVQQQLATFGGGGAVWLWDLEDVDIGIPDNSTYPVIADNSPLVFDSAKEQWVPGTPGGSGIGSFLPLTGGTMTGDINFNPGQQFAGTLELAGGTMTGEIGFTTQQTFPGALATTGGTMIGTITFDNSQTFPGAFISTDGGNISGDTTYTGSTIGTTSLQTRNSVNSLIASQVSGGFNFIGTTNVATDAPGAGVTGGDFYINTAVGIASTTWTGIAGLTIAADQLIIYSNNDTRWFAGAVEDNSTYLQKAGGTMTGPLTLNPEAFFVKERKGSGNQDFIIEGTTATSVGDTEGKLFFVNRNTVNNDPDAINYDGLTTNDENLQNKKSVEALITTNNNTNNYLQKAGGTMTGTLNTKDIFVATSNVLTIKRGNSNTSIGGLDIKGYAYNDFQAETDIFAVSYGNGTSIGDSINYKGKTDGTNNIQTKRSMDAAIASAITDDGNLLRGGSVRSTGGTADNSGTIDIFQTSLADSGELNLLNSSSEFKVRLQPDFGITLGSGTPDSDAKQIFFNTSSASGAFFKVNNSGRFHFADQSNDFMTLNASSLTLNSPAIFSGSTFTVNRGVGSSSNTTNFNIRGMLTNGGATDSSFVSIKRSSSQGDTLQYFGNTSTNDNTVQTYGSVGTRITNDAITPGTWAFINKASGTGSTLDGFYLVEYKRDQCGNSGDYMVTILVDAEDSSDDIAVGDVVCKLPAGYRPGTDTSGMVYAPQFGLVNTNSYTATATCMIKSDGSIEFIAVAGSSKKFHGQCTFSTKTTD